MNKIKKIKKIKTKFTRNVKNVKKDRIKTQPLKGVAITIATITITMRKILTNCLPVKMNWIKKPTIVFWIMKKTKTQLEVGICLPHRMPQEKNHEVQDLLLVKNKNYRNM